MMKLVGIREAHYPEESDCEKTVALFTSEQKASDYVEWAKLKSYSNWCGRGRHGKQFRKHSLLWPFCGAYVECYDDDFIPTDPPME